MTHLEYIKKQKAEIMLALADLDSNFKMYDYNSTAPEQVSYGTLSYQSSPQGAVTNSGLSRSNLYNLFIFLPIEVGTTEEQEEDLKVEFSEKILDKLDHLQWGSGNTDTWSIDHESSEVINTELGSTIVLSFKITTLVYISL